MALPVEPLVKLDGGEAFKLKPTNVLVRLRAEGAGGGSGGGGSVAGKAKGKAKGKPGKKGRRRGGGKKLRG